MVIIYTSNTGFTAQYATLLGEKTGCSVYTLAEAKKSLDKGTEAIYLGWLMAGHIQGLDKAVRQFRVKAACGVGLSLPSKGTLDTLAKSNYAPNAPLFYLPGGYNPDKLKGIRRAMLNVVLSGIRQKLAAKPNRTEEDYLQLEIATKGGSLVDEKHLEQLLGWLQEG